MNIPGLVGLCWTITFHEMEDTFWMTVTQFSKEGTRNLTSQLTAEEYEWWKKILC